MRIVHLLFDDYPYFSSWGYQENKMANIEAQQGNDVTILTMDYIPDVLKAFVKESELQVNSGIDDYNVRIVRLSTGIPTFRSINKKIKKYFGLRKKLEEIKPELLFVHDIHALSMFDVKWYMKRHKADCYCIADIHINYANSAKNKVSKYLLHRFFYRWIVQRTQGCIEKLFYLDEPCRRFVESEYDLHRSYEMLSLGGNSIVKEEKDSIKSRFLREQQLNDNTVVFLHSGKMTRQKNTIELLQSFSSVPDPSFLLLIIGKVSLDIEEDFKRQVEEDHRIRYLGWQPAEELSRYLSICDVYLQPGTPSATAQEAMCKGCALVVNVGGGFYENLFPNDVAYKIKKIDELTNVFVSIREDRGEMESLKKRSLEYSIDALDYKNQIRRIHQETNSFLEKNRE